MRTNSLRPQLLAGLLIPLAIFALVQFSVAFRTAESVARGDTDRMLAASVHTLAENVAFGDHGLEATVPPSALGMFDLGYGDAVYYRVAGPDGRLLAGYMELPEPPSRPAGTTPLFYDGTFAGQPIRLAALLQPVPLRGGTADVSVVVAETLIGRTALSRRLWMGSAFEEFLLVALACALAWFGLRRVLAPLVRLSNEVRERGPDEYAPFAVGSLQAELAPLVNALNAYMRRLQSQLDAQRRFTANAAHQLRTPLALLRTQASYALRTSNDGERADATRAIISTTQQITRLSNQLLSLAKAEPNGQVQKRDRLDLVAMTRAILEEFGPLAVDRQIDLAFDVAPNAGAPIWGDRASLRDLIVNVVDNAIRYTPVRGRVHVAIAHGNGRCVLHIDDTGPGIPAASRALVFERFYRLPGRDVEGSGLGLAIVKEIVDAHGGTISLSDGRFGAGLTIEIAFPSADGRQVPMSLNDGGRHLRSRFSANVSK